MNESRWVTAIVAGIVIGFAGLGCDSEVVTHPDGDEAWEMAHAVTIDDDEVVARVNEQVIGVDDVAEEWRLHPELTATEVLDVVVEREILALDARARGYHTKPEVSFARKQGMVSALLRHEVEEAAEPATDEERAERLQQTAAIRRAPEGLRASHLVVLVPEELEGDDGTFKRLSRDDREAMFDQGQDYIEEALQRLDGRVDDDALREVAQGLNDEDRFVEGFEAVVNEHIRFPRASERYLAEHMPRGWSSVVSEFAEGAESVAGDDRRGELTEPVRSNFGWHLIRVDDVIAARPVETAAAEEYVAQQLWNEAYRKKYLEMLNLWADGVDAALYPERLGSIFDQ